MSRKKEAIVFNTQVYAHFHNFWHKKFTPNISVSSDVQDTLKKYLEDTR